MAKDPKRVASGKKSKRKGSSFELKTAKQFQEWWGKGEFCRSPGSGGWGRPQHKQGFNASGDIITTNRDFPWCIECKHQEGWTLDQLLLNEGCIIWSWWDQAKDETPDDLEPLLIFKKNRQEPMVMSHSLYTEGNIMQLHITHKFSNGETEVVQVSRLKDLLSLPASNFIKEDNDE